MNEARPLPATMGPGENARWQLITLLLIVALTVTACNRNSDPEDARVEPAGATAATATTNAPVPEATAADAADAVAPGSAQEAAAAPTATADPTKGNVVLWHSYGRADGDALAKVLANLQDMYPELTVETLFVAYDDLPQAYTDAVLAGGGPDLIAAPTWWINDMIAADVLLPLDGLVASGVREAYWPAALANLERDGQLYGLPLTYEVVSLFVNTGLAPVAEAPLTTGEMLKLAQSSPERGAGLYANLYHLFWGLPAYGGDLMDAQGVVILDQGEGVAGFLEWLNSMEETPGTFVDLDYGMLMDRFKKGEFAYFVDGPWAIDELRGALGDSLAVAPLPAGPQGPAQPWLSTEGVMINPLLDAAQSQRALLVARGLTDAAAGNIWATSARRLPAARDAEVDGDALLLGFQRQAAAATPMPAQEEMAGVWGYAGDMIIKVLNEVMPAAEAVVEASALINEENGK